MRLSSKTLPSVAAGVALPGYDRAAARPGIVHLGVGAFARAHQAAYIEECMARGETGWGIVGASLRSPDMRDALSPQDGLYTMAVRSGDSARRSTLNRFIATHRREIDRLLDQYAVPRAARKGGV